MRLLNLGLERQARIGITVGGSSSKRECQLTVDRLDGLMRDKVRLTRGETLCLGPYLSI